MSVRKGERTEGNLQVLNLSAELAAYTLQICSNEKVFPKKQRWVTTQKLVNECIDAVTCIRRANAKRGNTYHKQENMNAFYRKLITGGKTDEQG